MPRLPPPHPRRRIRVVLSSTALLSFTSVRKAAALSIAELGIAAFFVASAAAGIAGRSAGWVVLAAAVLGAFVRAIDIESWVLFVPGGFMGRAQLAFGPAAASAAAAVRLVERVLLAALACLVVGQYSSSVAVVAVIGRRVSGHVRPEDFAIVVAVVLIGLLWIRGRIGFDIASDTMARAVWMGVGLLALAVGWGTVSALRSAPGDGTSSLLSSAPLRVVTDWPIVAAVVTYVVAFAVALPVVGGSEALARAAHELPPPRVRALRRVALLVSLFTLAITTFGTFLFTRIVPGSELTLWAQAPLAGLAQHLVAPAWARNLITLALIAAAALVLVPAAHITLEDAEQLLQRLSSEGIVSEGLAFLHARFGTPSRAFDAAATAIALVIVASGGRVTWLSQAYATAMAAALLFNIAVLVRLRRSRASTRPFVAPFNLQIGARMIPAGLIVSGLLVAAGAVTLIATGDLPSIAAAAALGLLVVSFTTGATTLRRPLAVTEESNAFDFLPAPDLSPDQIDARPGNVLVPVRNPHALAHVAAALRAAGDRDVVVMTVRLVGVDVSEDASANPAPTPPERQLLSEIVALSERHGRPVRLLIVPAHDVFDGVVATILRLRSSDVYVGESSTLSADDQARLLGEAWERAEKPEPLNVRLVVQHTSGRSDSYYLGAHPPSLTPADLDLIHRVWRDAAKAIGPHVHHHDVVRAALTKMEEQLKGPERDEALAAIRHVVRPAEELAAVLHARDYARLRDMMRNRHAGDVAALLTELSVEDQVVVFRVLPRKDAAAVFEYLSQDAKETLLKAMAQEDVAALLNNMAPDDRTMFLEELPATATRQLLSLLTAEERSVAVTLLGYPDRSVGRLMTPDYVAVREHWTIQEVLDYIRVHGHDSETLNHIYVVDEQDLLIDDIRIRELLLTSPSARVSGVMDRHFVALKATDDQEAAVADFRRYDRTALPVTDTAGMLIGVVTIDDVLDVAEAAATREIQRIGGSEALDEPYMEIAFGRMIRKRAGWLTALFLGEMLTATAMGVFETEISRAVVLALFVPLIISSGGNTGSQAATLVIRALALGEVQLRDWWRVMRREILAGLALGAILGAIGFLRITVWSAFSHIYGEHWLLVALTVAFSLVGVALWGTLTGSVLPFILRRLGFDPAASSAPFVATLVDVTGLVIYFSVATVILRGTLL